MNVILGTSFSLILGVWRLRIRIAIEDTALDCFESATRAAGDA